MSEAITGLKDFNPSINSTSGRIRGLLGLTWKLLLLPISVIGGSLGLVTGSIGLSFWVAGFVLSYWLNMIGLTNSGRNRKPSPTPSVSGSVAAAAEASEARDFLSEFESQYGNIHPNFVSGGFMDVVERSGRQGKLLFVYLHSPDHPDTLTFCKETLCLEFLSDFVNENFISWGDSIQENEGLEISKNLNASRFPFSAVIKGAAGESFSLLRQFEGPSSPEEMVTELHTVLEEENATALVAASVDTIDDDEQTNNTPSREEEDAPSGSALETDQGNEFQNKEDQNVLEIEAESEAKLSEEEAPPLESEPEQGDPDVIQVFVRLPTGERIGRLFPCSATLQSVYDFVDSSGCLDIGSYDLVTFFPRIIYGQHQHSSTLEDLELHPQTSLFVELNS